MFLRFDTAKTHMDSETKRQVWERVRFFTESADSIFLTVVIAKNSFLFFQECLKFATLLTLNTLPSLPQLGLYSVP